MFEIIVMNNHKPTMTTLLINIKNLLQVRDPSVIKVERIWLALSKSSFLLIKGSVIANYGPMTKFKRHLWRAYWRNRKNGITLPGATIYARVYAETGRRICRPHQRFNTKRLLTARWYLNSAKMLPQTSEGEIYEQSKIRLKK
jgi:imidazolonepropionase